MVEERKKLKKTKRNRRGIGEEMLNFCMIWHTFCGEHIDGAFFSQLSHIYFINCYVHRGATFGHTSTVTKNGFANTTRCSQTVRWSLRHQKTRIYWHSINQRRTTTRLSPTTKPLSSSDPLCRHLSPSQLSLPLNWGSATTASISSSIGRVETSARRQKCHEKSRSR